MMQATLLFKWTQGWKNVASRTSAALQRSSFRSPFGSSTLVPRRKSYVDHEGSSSEISKQDVQDVTLFESAENTFKCFVARHDHHNIEIKTICEGHVAPLMTEVDLFLFIPRNFDLPSWSKSDLEKDFRSRLRLAIPQKDRQNEKALDQAHAELAQAIRTVQRAIHQNPQHEKNASLQKSSILLNKVSDLSRDDAILEPARDVGALTAETLKQWRIEQTRDLLLAHLPRATEASCLRGLTTLETAVLRAANLMRELRNTWLTVQYKYYLFRSLDEYLGQLYVQYLGALQTELQMITGPPILVEKSAYFFARERLELTLAAAIFSESTYQRDVGWAAVKFETDIERETRLVRMGHLKKFFQSRSFVDVSRRPAAKGVAEWTALMGTALAGLAAASFQRFSDPDSFSIASNGFFVLLLGVAIYVLRDRLKDRAKAALHEQARKYVPDYEQDLFAREQKIGTIKEWFRICDRTALPPAIRDIRHQTSASDLEVRLPEDILHYRKTHEVVALGVGWDSTSSNSAAEMSRPRKTGPRSMFSQVLSPFQRLATFSYPPYCSPTPQALHENVRLNLERYLKHMDDPFKDLLELDSQGLLKRHRSHRVYHFHLCVRFTRSVKTSGLRQVFRTSNQSVTSRTEIFRIVLDKNGIVRVEELAQ